jgi:hypothetical protein
MGWFLSTLEWIGRTVRQQESIEIVADSPALLVLRHKGKLTQFVGKSQTVIQYDRRVAPFTAIRSVALRKHTDEDGPAVWSVDLLLSNDERISIGRSTDDVASSISAARISSITGKPVTF